MEATGTAGTSPACGAEYCRDAWLRAPEWSADKGMPLIRRQPGHETSRNADVDRASGGWPYTRRMSVPPPNGRRPVMAAVAIVLIVGLVLLFVVAM